LITALGKDHRRLLDDLAAAHQELLARFEAERAGLATEILGLRGLLGDLQGEAARLQKVSPDVESTPTPALPDLRPEVAQPVSPIKPAEPAKTAEVPEAALAATVSGTD